MAPFPSARRSTVLAALVLVIAGCGGDAVPTSTTAPPVFPSVVVDAWLDALAVGDFDTAASHVEPVGASFVLAIENGFAIDQLAELVESGWSPALTASFWSSFRGEFAGFSGEELRDLVVGRHTELEVAEGGFAAVQVAGGAGEVLVITRLAAGGVWQVDLLATLGSAFAPFVVDRLGAAADTPAAVVIREAVAGVGLASLDAAAAANPDDTGLSAEIVLIRRALAG